MMPPSNDASRSHDAIDLTVVAPARDEADNVDLLVEQVHAALAPTGLAFEFLIIDDASTDATADRVRALMPGRPWLRLISLPPFNGGGNGQSAAFKVGFAAARGRLIGVLDADLQNDPADLPRMIDHMHASGADFVQGDRSAARRAGDAWIRLVGSVVGRVFRRMILGDSIRDTGCSLRLMKREIALALPLEFKGMHRFIPVTARRLGYTVVEMPVAHRPRHAGEPKYGMGISQRAIPGLIDCFAVRWMSARRRMPGPPVEHRPESALNAERSDRVTQEAAP
ncbi:MAG: glycosyltransferase family 2 protein [Phycisphaerales bacterium]|nr:glycosyltransferase family 2 protein [Planctomycetota bacterium]MCH8509177.1 glycosyltransferase family 2 protein [Phycisphaerales bacterium]